MTGDGTNERGAQPPRTLFSLGREGSKRRRGGTDVAEAETESERPAPTAEPCADCGAELVAGAAFCGECGKPVATTELIDEDLGLDEAGESAELIDEDLGLDDEIVETELLDENFEIDEELLALGVIDPDLEDATDDTVLDEPVLDETAVEDDVSDELVDGDVLDDDLVDDGDLEAHGEEDLIDGVAVDDDLLDEELVAEDETPLDAADDDNNVGPALALVGGAAAAGAVAKGKARGKNDDDAEQVESGLTVLAAARDQGPPPKVVKPAKAPKDPGDGKRVPIGWIIGGIAAAILIVVGVVALAGGGDSGKKDDVASTRQSTTTTTRESTTTTSTAVTTTTQPTTTSSEDATTTSAAPATQAPQTTIINIGPAPEAPKTPPALRVAALTCPLGDNPCTIPHGGSLTVTLVNDGGQSGGYNLSGPGLQGPSGQLVGSVSITVRDTVGQPDRLATLHITGAGGLDQAYPVLMK